jgi:hypothetical protein
MTVHRPETYQIRVQGCLDSDWSAWLDNLTVTSVGDGTTMISGPVADQAALHGLLDKLHGLNMPLLSLCRTEPE